MTREKILLVEDELLMAELIALQLEDLGYTIAAMVATGEEAIAKTGETQPDLVLMDIILPGNIDGIAAAREIGDRFETPVVFITGSDDLSTFERAKNASLYGYLIKPFTEKNLRVAIEVALAQHQRERALKQNQPPYGLWLRSIGDGVIATDRQGSVVFMNPAAEAMTGWTLAEARGQGFGNIVPLVNQITATPIENPVGQVMREGNIVYLEENTALVARNGDRIAIGDSASPIYQETGEINGAVLVFWKLRKQPDAEIVDIQLQRELNQLRRQCLSIIVHELRTPLSTILSSTGLLQLYSDQLPEDSKAEQLAQIERAVQQMSETLEAVQVLSQTEAGRLPFHPEPLELGQFCHELVAQLRHSEGNNREIVFTQQGDCTEAHLDVTLVGFILRNLLSNAVKYSPVSSVVRFDVTCHPASEMAIFQIQDRGIGISSEDVSHLFELFFRGENVGEIPGIGLGLAIVKQCVDLHHGEISFTSELGVGTTVTVRLPLVGSRIE